MQFIRIIESEIGYLKSRITELKLIWFYRVKHVALDTNECASSPCMSGGTCVDGINKYTCKCAPGYTGTNCLTSKFANHLF